MPEPHRRGMQVQQLRRPIRALSLALVAALFARRPVPPIAHDRMSRGRQVRAYLVVPPGLQPHAHERRAARRSITCQAVSASSG